VARTRAKPHKKSFDEKFGDASLAALPTDPGVYRFYDAHDALIYVGKAINLRRRVSQYKNAKRRKKHAKMRSIVADAARLEFDACASHLEACLLELKLIQELRPKWNVAGAFHFLYPMIGLRHAGGELAICYTTQPELFAGYEFHGAFRSRSLARDAFFALSELLMFVGHRSPRRRSQRFVKFSHEAFFRQLPESWLPLWRAYFRGESTEALATLVLSLVENAAARRKPRVIQERLNELKRFWKHEARELKRVLESQPEREYPLAQRDRDTAFLTYRLRLEAETGKKPPSSVSKAAASV
jgi:excinuclease ABC subunit C